MNKINHVLLALLLAFSPLLMSAQEDEIKVHVNQEGVSLDWQMIF